VNPTTSQPSPAAFIEVYENLAAQGFDILSMHISSKLSGTMDSATQARAALPKLNIELHDSLSTSMCLGFQVLAVIRAAEQGASLKECKALAEQARQHSGVLFLLNTLEFLRRGGRIGGAQAFLGTALNLKPILEVRDGRVESIDKVRTWNKAMDRLLELFEQRVDKRVPIRIGGLYGGASEESAALLERARQRFGVSEVSETLISPVSPVIGVHTGPGVVGLAYIVKF
jgi:DegV family protein with EDD domain